MNKAKTESPSQNDMVLKHLKAGRALNPLTALSKFGIMRLGARIFDLRKMGYEIETRLVQTKTRYGHRCQIAIYKMTEFAKLVK